MMDDLSREELTELLQFVVPEEGDFRAFTLTQLQEFYTANSHYSETCLRTLLVKEIPYAHARVHRTYNMGTFYRLFVV